MNSGHRMHAALVVLAIAAAFSFAHAETPSLSPSMKMDLLLRPSVSGVLHPNSRSENGAISSATVVLVNPTSLEIQENVIDVTQLAWGEFEDTLNKTGWGVLDLQTSGDVQYTDTMKSFAAGVLEGFMTAPRIWEQYQNINQTLLGESAVSEIVATKSRKFLSDQYAYAVSASSPTSSDPFWRHIAYIMAQLDGLQQGYNLYAQNSDLPTLDMMPFLILNGVGDLLDIIPAVSPSHLRTDWLGFESLDAVRSHASFHELCSGLIKVSSNYTFLGMAHSSFFTYASMNRIFKHYTLNFSDPSTAARRISFSSYPGFLESLDDFYMMDSGLGMTQTSNGVYNHSAYEVVQPASLLAWQRVRAATAMSSSGSEWADVLRRNHSGTYANQYMVVDFKLFTPGQPLKPGTLVVAEEMPGIVESTDATQFLERGYWPSYNRPFFRSVYNASGYPSMVEKYGVYFSYQLSPRAEMFRRDQTNVRDVESLKKTMRYNEYKTDPLSQGNPSNAICARGDLASPPHLGGCYDTKVTSYTDYMNGRTAYAINGPTTNGGLYRPFEWSKEVRDMAAHVGEPHTYDFAFERMRAKEFSA